MLFNGDEFLLAHNSRPLGQNVLNFSTLLFVESEKPSQNIWSALTILSFIFQLIFVKKQTQHFPFQFILGFRWLEKVFVYVKFLFNNCYQSVFLLSLVHNTQFHLLLFYHRLLKQTGKLRIKEWARVIRAHFRILHLSVFIVCNGCNECCLFLTFFSFDALVEERCLRLIESLEFSFDEGSENAALCELISKGTNLCHSEITQKVLHFKYIRH